MNLKKTKRNFLVFAVALCVVLTGCSAKEKKSDHTKDNEIQITEAVQGNSERTENQGNDETDEIVGNGENPGTAGTTTLVNADFNGDGVEDSLCAREIDKSGMMKDLHLVLKDESGETTVQVPQTVTITCYQESGTEFRISCDGLFLGNTTLDEKPAYGTLGHYLETTMGMEKEGNAYSYTISGSEFSMLDAECHGGAAIWCRGKLYVEGKEFAATWTQEYSLGKWVLTSMELPIWNVNGTNTGWGLGKGEMTETEKKGRYVGFLDEAFCYRDKDTLEDFDGDGTLDRIFRDRSDNVSYTIHFGNGKELLITDDAIGDWINWYVWQANEETTMFLFQESGSGTGGGWTILHLYMQTDEGLVPMELPDGPTLIAEVVSERQIALYRNEEKVATFHLDESYTFRDLAVEEWLEWYTTEENGAHVLQISSYDEFHIMDDRIQWRTHMGDRWGAFCLAWDTKYVDGAWEITDVTHR